MSRFATLLLLSLVTVGGFTQNIELAGRSTILPIDPTKLEPYRFSFDLFDLESNPTTLKSSLSLEFQRSDSGFFLVDDAGKPLERLIIPKNASKVDLNIIFDKDAPSRLRYFVLVDPSASIFPKKLYLVPQSPTIENTQN